MNTSVINILNLKLRDILSNIKDKNINIDDIITFLKHKNYFPIDESYYIINDSTDDLIKTELIYLLNKEPKFLSFHKTLNDVQNTMIKIATKKNLEIKVITEDYINDILISWLNSTI